MAAVIPLKVAEDSRGHPPLNVPPMEMVPPGATLPFHGLFDSVIIPFENDLSAPQAWPRFRAGDVARPMDQEVTVFPGEAITAIWHPEPQLFTIV